MKKIIATIAFFLSLHGSALASGELHLDSANVDLTNQASLQRGAKLFVNYCLSCHTAKYMRYNVMARDIGLTKEDVEENLMFTTDKIGDTMTVAISEKDAAKWFGTLPPDLSVMSRAKGAGAAGADWLYTYLRGFYADPSRPFGMNNTVFKDVGMPNVLAELQGTQVAHVEEKMDDHGAVHTETTLELAEQGSMTPDEFDTAVRDLVSFMVYMGEPAQLVRYEIGKYVIAFLLILLVLTFLLKKEYWKDVH